MTLFVNPATLCGVRLRGSGRVRNKLYTIPTCPHCAAARSYLVAKGADFIEFDVSRDVRALRDLVERTARTEVPAIVAGEFAVVGFNPASWEVFLARSEAQQKHDPWKLPDSLGQDPYEGVD